MTSIPTAITPDRARVDGGSVRFAGLRIAPDLLADAETFTVPPLSTYVADAIAAAPSLEGCTPMSDYSDQEFGSHESHDGHSFEGDTYLTEADEWHHGGESPLAGAAIHGDPTQAVSYWFKQTMEDCVPASVTQVLSEAVGHPVPEQEVIDRMIQLHMTLFTATDGVDFHDAEALLRSFGIPSHTEEHVSLSTLAGYLDEGRSVVLGLDPDPIWYHGKPDAGEGHAVMITSIDETNGTVTLSDTGTPDGNMETVPLNVFMHAWGEKGNELVVTDHPVSGHGGPALMPLTLNSHPGQDPDAPAEPVPAMFPHMVENAPAPHTDSKPSSSATPGESYTVRPGDTLWDLAERAYGNGADFKVIAQANGISNPDLITPGLVLRIPAEAQ
jgi:LysM repeat protein